MADNDAKHALQERHRALQEKAEAAVPNVDNLDGLPNLVTRRIFRLPIVKAPADLKALIMGALAGIITFFALIGSLMPMFWPVYILISFAVIVKVTADFTQGDGVELKPLKPQKKASKVIGDVVWAGPYGPLEERLVVVHRGREVDFETWFDQEVSKKDKRSIPVATAVASASKAPRAGGA